MANERKNSPTTPERRPRGAKTTTVGEGGARNRAEDLVGPLPDDGGGGLVRMEGESPLDILDDHDGIVDDDSDGDREAAQAHQVERSSREGDAQERDGDGERKRQRGGERGAPLAEEEQQHRDGEDAADQHGVANAVHRLADQRRLIVYGLESDARGEQRSDGVDRRLHRALQTEVVTLRLPGHVDECCGTAIAGHDLEEILGAIADTAEVAHAYGAIADTTHDDLAHGFRRVGQSRHHDGVLLVVAVDAAGSGSLVRVLDGLGDLVHSDLIGDEACGIELDADLPYPSALHLDLTRLGETREARAHDEVSEITEHEVDRRRSTRTEASERPRDRAARQRGRHRREGRPEGREPALHLAQGELHVGLGTEVETQLGRASHRPGADALEPDDSARRPSSRGRVTATVISSASNVPPRASTTMRGYVTSG